MIRTGARARLLAATLVAVSGPLATAAQAQTATPAPPATPPVATTPGTTPGTAGPTGGSTAGTEAAATTPAANAPDAERPEPVEAEPPARQLTFSISQGITLDRTGAGWSVGATTGLGLDLVAETPISSLRFALDGDVVVRDLLGDGDPDFDVEGPVARFAYERAVPSASLRLGATYRSRPIAGFSSLDDIDFFDLPADFVLPDDLNDLVGDGTRTVVTADARLTLRDDRPLRFAFDLRYDETIYDGVIVPGLLSNREITAGATAIARVNPVLDVSLGVVRQQRVVEEVETEVATDYVLGASLDRPLGALTAEARIQQDEDGDTTTSFALGRVLEQPLYRLSGRIGAATDEAGDLTPTLVLDYERTLSNGELGATLRYELGTDSSGLERDVTSLTARYRRELTPTTSASLVALYDQRSATALTPGSSLVEIGATVSRELTPDWSVELGYRHSIRDEDGGDSSNSDRLSLSIGRTFSIGF